MEKTNISVEKVNFMEWKTNEKYNHITIGTALHWLPIEQSLIKMRNMLEDGGILTVYGYILY